MYGKRSRFLTIMLAAGMAFFYIPMILLVIYSFNYSKLVPVWGGWSLRCAHVARLVVADRVGAS